MNHSWIKILPGFFRARLEGRHVLQKTIVNTGWLFFDQVVRLAVGLLIGVLFARYLGPEEYGIFSFALAFVTLFSAFATLGLDSVVVREIIKYPEAADEILGTSFLIKLIAGALTVVLTITVVTLMRPDDTLIRWLVLLISAGAVFQAFETINFWFQSQIRSKYVVLAKTVAFLVANGGRLALIYAKAPLIAFAWISLAEFAMGAAGLLIVYRLKGTEFKKWRMSFPRAVGFLKDSWPLALSSMLIMVYMRIDQIMIGEMIGDDAVGIYSAALRLSEAWSFIPMVIASSVFPSIVDAKKIDEKLYNDRMQQLYFLMCWISFSIAVPMMLFSDKVIRLLYGASYAGAATILSIHIWSSVFVCLGVASAQYLLAENDTKIAFLRTAAGAAVNIVLNLVLIPVFGIKGAAVASLAAYFSATFVIALFGKTRQQSMMMLKSLFLIPMKRAS